MTINEIENAAYNKKMPGNMKFPQLYLYYMLESLYSRFENGDISEQDGMNIKNQIMENYEQCLKEYAAQTTIIKLLRHHRNPVVANALREIEKKVKL